MREEVRKDQGKVNRYYKLPASLFGFKVPTEEGKSIKESESVILLEPSVWSRIGTRGQLTLLSLGIHADKDGYCFPSLKTIAKTLGRKVKRKDKERWDTAFVRKGMEELRKEGLVENAVKPGWPKGYRLGKDALAVRSKNTEDKEKETNLLINRSYYYLDEVAFNAIINLKPSERSLFLYLAVKATISKERGIWTTREDECRRLVKVCKARRVWGADNQVYGIGALKWLNVPEKVGISSASWYRAIESLQKNRKGMKRLVCVKKGLYAIRNIKDTKRPKKSHRCHNP